MHIRQNRLSTYGPAIAGYARPSWRCLGFPTAGRTVSQANYRTIHPITGGHLLACGLVPERA